LDSSETTRPKLLLDEQLFGLREYLDLQGWVVAQRKAGTPDLVLIKAARDEGLVIVSRDKDLIRKCEFAGVRCQLVASSGAMGDIARTLDRSLRDQLRG
jgi:uncharacterized protein with PIN domain